MPEGDTIHHAAARIGAVLQGRVPEEILTPHPRCGSQIRQRGQWENSRTTFWRPGCQR